jgi:chemotaxis response regulator CheB
MAASALVSEYKVMTMLSVKKIFALLEKKQPDIILINNEMPELEAINMLKEHPEWKEIPVIMLDKNYDPASLLDIVRHHTQPK